VLAACFPAPQTAAQAFHRATVPLPKSEYDIHSVDRLFPLHFEIPSQGNLIEFGKIPCRFHRPQENVSLFQVCRVQKIQGGEFARFFFAPLNNRMFYMYRYPSMRQCSARKHCGKDKNQSRKPDTFQAVFQKFPHAGQMKTGHILEILLQEKTNFGYTFSAPFP